MYRGAGALGERRREKRSAGELGRKMAQGRKEPRRVLGERRVAVGMGFGGNGRGRIRKESEGRGTKGKDQERKAEAQRGARERGRRWEHTDEKEDTEENEDRGRQGRNTPLSGRIGLWWLVFLNYALCSAFNRKPSRPYRHRVLNGRKIQPVQLQGL